MGCTINLLKTYIVTKSLLEVTGHWSFPLHVCVNTKLFAALYAQERQTRRKKKGRKQKVYSTQVHGKQHIKKSGKHWIAPFPKFTPQQEKSFFKNNILIVA